MIDQALDPETAERAATTKIDWGNAWVGMTPEGLAAWPDAAAGAMGCTSLGVGCVLELVSVLEPVRRDPAHRSEMISELRAGEHIRGLTRRGNWWLVAGEDGYVGWVHEWVLAASEPVTDPAPFRYALPAGTMWTSDHLAGEPLLRGTPLWPETDGLQARGGMLLLRTATGATGWIPEAQVEERVALGSPRELLNAVRGLVGTPYRWGGRSPMGFDCSGLVQFVAQLAGAGLPRDASQQAAVGADVGLDPGGWEAGDLLFFGEPADHVGFFDARGQLFHCRGRVRIDEISELGGLMERVSAARRWWGLRGVGPVSNWTGRVPTA